MRKWLPENHIVRFIIEAVGQLDIGSFKVNEGGSGVSAGREKPLEDYQYNFTAPESRIMLTGKKEFEQCYNAQAAVDVDTMLIVSGYVTNRGNDKQELKPAVDRADREVYTPETVYARIQGIIARKR
ncbi:MAG: hypothetical protein LBQ67_04865 [Treponema sp.]|nr:hypothetical protein [Treponema sp.]